MTNANVMVG